MKVNKSLDLTDAIKRDVSVFGGTQAELSRQVCGSNQGLRHKIAQFRGSSLRPEELIVLQQISGGRHTVQEMSRLLGGVFVALPEEVNVDEATSNIYISLGLLHSAMREACSDGVISACERVELEQKAQWAVSAIFAWVWSHFEAFGELENV